MNLLNRFCETEFESYQDFAKNFRINVPEQFNFGYDIVDEYAALEPNKRALVWCNDRGENRTMTFGELKEASDRAAGFLYSLGIRKGDPVMMILKRRIEFWICIVALHKLGAIAIPATHMMMKKDIVYRNNAASVKAIITCDDERLLETIDQAAAESPSLELKIVSGMTYDGWLNLQEGMAQVDPGFSVPEAERPGLRDIMLMYFTSGTTGFPKMAYHDYSYPLGHILTAKFWQQVVDDGLHLTVADTGWAKCAWGKIYGQWISGTAIFVYDYEGKFSAHDLLEQMCSHGVTTFCVPPTIYRSMIKEDLSAFDFSSLVHCSSAGEPLNPEVIYQWERITGLRICEGYGQTETVPLAAMYKGVEIKTGAIGRPTPGLGLTLLDPEGNPVEAGEVGQVAINIQNGIPVGIFRGYYRDEEKTAAVMRDGYYWTGDMAWKDEDGYIWFVGRDDDVIKSSGYRIGPFEVESALVEHPSVLECAVVGVPDPARGQVVKASIVLAKGYCGSDALIKELQNHVKKVTAPYKYPRIIEFVDELPKTISGKIKRKEIRAQHGQS